jgi:hypothetical protein
MAAAVSGTYSTLLCRLYVFLRNVLQPFSDSTLNAGITELDSGKYGTNRGALIGMNSQSSLSLLWKGSLPMMSIPSHCGHCLKPCTSRLIKRSDR